MVYIIVGLVIIAMVIGVFLVARQDWNEDVSDISPFQEEVDMVRTVQVITKVVTLILSAILICLGTWLIVRGLAIVF